jgi:hypothetical protein
MFPSPQDALPLPQCPSLERYKKIAKALAKACSSANPNSIADWSEEWVETIVRLSGERNTPQLSVRTQSWINELEQFAKTQLLKGDPTVGKCALADAQFVIARSHGFESWPKFAKQLQALARNNSLVSRFEAAADAIVHGDLATLKHLLREDPELVRARSNREHGAALLHYVSANGVEGYRQKTPANIIEITEQLLNAGAEIDAAAKVYGGGCTALGLTATSVHPERAGVQESLLQVLLNHGAGITQPSIAGRDKSIVSVCLANGRLRAAAFLVDRGASLDVVSAAGLGRLDAVKSACDENGGLAGTTKEQRQEALLYACAYGRNDVVDFLLAQGADAALGDGDGQTALHRAVIGAHLNTVKLLLRNSPALERANAYGGTVIDQALWSAAHGGDPDVYLAILEVLAAAGAKLPEFHVPVNTRVDAWLAQRGSAAKSGWSWPGEKPRRQR